MKKTVGSFTEDKLRELAEQPNVTVMMPAHNNTYDPWPAKRVMECVDRLVAIIRSGATAEDAKKDDELLEFSKLYLTFFVKLTTPEFARDDTHVETVKKIVALRMMVEKGLLDETHAQAQSADVALQSLVARVKK